MQVVQSIHEEAPWPENQNNLPPILAQAMCTSEHAISLWFPQYKRWLRYQQVTHGDYIWNIDECPLPDL